MGCQGDCDVDADCATGLQCFQRSASEKIPGCKVGGNGDVNKHDYCYAPSAPPQDVNLEHKGGSGCTPSNKCTACQGDCDVDGDCATGLKCFQRSASEKIPGCKVGGNGDVN